MLYIQPRLFSAAAELLGQLERAARVYQRLFWQVEGLGHRDQVVQVHGLLGDVAELHIQPLRDLEMLHRPLLVADQPGFFVVRGTE